MLVVPSFDSEFFKEISNKNFLHDIQCIYASLLRLYQFYFTSEEAFSVDTNTVDEESYLLLYNFRWKDNINIHFKEVEFKELA
jgi:hypothetical protein